MLRFRQEKTNWERIRKLPDPMAKTKEALVWTDMSYFSSGARGVGWRQVLQIIQIQTLLIHRHHRALGWDHRRGKVAAVLPNTNCLSLFWDRVSLCSPVCLKFHCVQEAFLKLSNLLTSAFLPSAGIKSTNHHWSSEKKKSLWLLPLYN